MALYKAIYRDSRLHARNTLEHPSLCDFATLWNDIRNRRTHSPSDDLSVPDLDSSHIGYSTSLPYKYRRKLEILPPNRPGSRRPASASSSACTTFSSRTVAEPMGDSPVELLKVPMEAPTFNETDYTPALATNDSTTKLSTISDPVTISNPASDKVLKFEGVASPTSTSIPLSTTDTDVPRATGYPALLSHQNSPLPSLSSSTSSTASSSGSSERSSATNAIDHNSSSTADAPTRGRKRKLTSDDKQNETRSTHASLRPLGPAHLERDYTVARKALSAAVAVAAYELHGFSVPVRNEEMEARRPSKDAIPLFRKHPLVRQAARAVDEADRALEAALARGETVDNTLIPDEWRWGSEYLRSNEWARLEPEPVRERRAKRIAKEVIEAADLGGPRTRARKRKRHAVSENLTRGQKEDVESDVPPHSSTDSKLLSAAVAAKVAPSAKSNDSYLSEATSSAAPVADPSETALPEKRKRGRPRKNTTNPSNMSSQHHDAAAPSPSTTPFSFSAAVPTSTVADRPSSPSPVMVKRKRGRPRKHPLPHHIC